MSQSQAVQTGIDPNAVMTPREAEQLGRIQEMVNLASFFKEAWTCEDYTNHTKIAQYNHHEPHEDCTGHLLIADIRGLPVYRRAISRLIARAPSMANLLEKALPIIRAEAAMVELANEIEAEINKARGLNETIQR